MLYKGARALSDMGNLLGRLTGGLHEETIKIALGDCGWARSSREQTSEYMSVRAEAMMRSRSEFSSDTDHEIEHSKLHWSQRRGAIDGDDNNDEKDVIQENRQVFSELQDNPLWMSVASGSFFAKGHLPSANLGEKIAEGGQAEIFQFLNFDGSVFDKVLLKVFKKGSRISQLRQQWPSGVLQVKVLQVVIRGSLLEDGRFAFLMHKCWGDLRKLIDQAMQAKNNQGPPFPFEWNGVTLHALHIMKEIAFQMLILHEESIVHRDMKASNILLWKDLSYPHLVVADFECSIGVVGTRFWRAPEILLGLKKRVPIDYSEKVDVYGYAMTCYEIVTGLLPFEGELERGSRLIDLVIEGRRPKLPSDLDVTLKGLIERCWDPNPHKRPTFLEICKIVVTMF